MVGTERLDGVRRLVSTFKSFIMALTAVTTLWVVPLMTYASKNNANEGGIGQFKAILLMTTDSDTALENWTQPTPGAHIPDTDIAIKGQAIEALVIFTGCKANDSGNCDTEIDYRIEAPDGSLYAEYLGTELWKDKPAIPEGKIQLAVDRVGFIADPEDQIGTYAIFCTVRDQVAGVEFSISSQFKIVETSKGGKQ